MKQLSNSQLKLVEQMENWATYRESDGALLAFNTISGREEPIRSFTLDNVPAFDALLLFGGSPRPVKYAALVMHYFKTKFGNYPEFITVGGNPNKGQQFSKAENEYYEDMMLQLGFPEEVVMKNHIHSISSSTRENIEEIKQVVRNSRVLNRLERPRIAVVTASGYSLRAAQELGLAFSEYELMFFETPVTSQDEALFVSELYSGYKIDILVASVWHSLNRNSWNVERLPLSVGKLNVAPDYESLKDLAFGGYTFYLYPNMMESLGFNAQNIYSLREQRFIEVTGKDLEGRLVGEGMTDASEIFQEELLNKFIEQIQEELVQKGIFIS